MTEDGLVWFLSIHDGISLVLLGFFKKKTEDGLMGVPWWFVAYYITLLAENTRCYFLKNTELKEQCSDGKRYLRCMNYEIKCSEVLYYFISH